MPVLAFVRPEPSPFTETTMAVPAATPTGQAENRLRFYGRVMQLCFVVVLAAWLICQTGCLLSLFLQFHSGIVAGTIDGTLAFKFWPLLDTFSRNHAVSGAFIPHAFPRTTAIGYTIILVTASVPFCASLLLLSRLFHFYAQGEVFTQRNATIMRRIGHCIMATGYSPLLLGPAAHAIGVLKPVTGMTQAMIAFILLGLLLLAMSHVMEIGQRMHQDQEGFL